MSSVWSQLFHREEKNRGKFYPFSSSLALHHMHIYFFILQAIHCKRELSFLTWLYIFPLKFLSLLKCMSCHVIEKRMDDITAILLYATLHCIMFFLHLSDWLALSSNLISFRNGPNYHDPSFFSDCTIAIQLPHHIIYIFIPTLKTKNNKKKHKKENVNLSRW